MDRDSFREALLQIMERKLHWADSALTGGLIPHDRLHVHMEQEYATYVRDFPIFLGRAYVQCPIAEVRQELAENLYEEETGGLSLGKPHPELFLRYPRGMGMEMSRFDEVQLSPASKIYRDMLDECTLNRGWAVGTVIGTVFVEGNRYERGELEEGAPKRPQPPFTEHPYVKHYGLSVEDLALTKAHRMVEGDHRAAAWRIVLGHVPEGERAAVVQSMEAVLLAWLGYRDGVAEACGLTRGADGEPELSGG